jgi:hypothetical protein
MAMLPAENEMVISISIKVEEHQDESIIGQWEPQQERMYLHSSVRSGKGIEQGRY